MELSDSDCREVEDVVVLEELTEDIIIRVLRLRYAKGAIYTNTGNVLMAINPFEQVPLYTDHILNIYRKAYLSKLDKLPPHPWKTAAKAYIQMFGDNRETCSLLKASTKPMRPQSVLVSGESGAGKTESTKIIMAFLAKISSLNRKRDSMGTIQCNVLEANTILDAVGNARTMRNDNSSRFGKYVKLHFDTSGELVGAGLDTFLLETTRVVRRNEDTERNFHIFYLLGSESDQSSREALKIRSLDTYTYLNSSGIYDRRDGIKDSDMLDQFKQSMSMLNIEPDDLQSLFKCFMAILTIGNVKFSSHTTTAGTVDIKVEESTQQFLTDVAELLEISPQELLQKFTTRTMVVVGDEVSVTLNETQAEELRDVFAKTLYSVIFAWLIEFLNVQLSTDDHSFDTYSLSATTGTPKYRRRSSHTIVTGIDQFGSRIRTDSDATATSVSAKNAGMIGILDIFGFEKQEHNGLEQLLINYANETLQKQYDEVMIDAEQAFYESENISWDFIEFPSNADCIELISSKGVSILSLLDEACLAPSGSDTSFIRQVYNVLSSHDRLHLTSRVKGSNAFGINHYAGTVIYSVSNFVKKNKNEIFPLEILTSSKNGFVTRMGKSASLDEVKGSGSSNGCSSPYAASPMKSGNNRKFLTATISNSFKKSVTQLLQTIDETQAHYVKCIKTNALNVKNNFDVELVSEQLRCNGIMQTIVVTRCGYPIRFTYDHFNDRYFSLMRALFKGKHFTIAAGVDAVIDRLRKALAAGEVTIRDSITSLNSIGGLNKTITKSSSNDGSVNNADLQGWGIQRGLTRVFLRYHEYAALDKMHNNTVGVMATTIQRVYRGFLCANVFRKMKKSAIQISRAFRQFQNRLYLMTQVLILQDFYRNYVCWHINRKWRAQWMICSFIYKHQSRVAERVMERKIVAARMITRWWMRLPFFISSHRKILLKSFFSDVIVPLQRGVRNRLAERKRKFALSNYRIKAEYKKSVETSRQADNKNNRKSVGIRKPSINTKLAAYNKPTGNRKSNGNSVSAGNGKSVGSSNSPSNSKSVRSSMSAGNRTPPQPPSIAPITPRKLRMTEEEGIPAWGIGNANADQRRMTIDESVSSRQSDVSCRDLLRANGQILWTIFSFYAQIKATIPGASVAIIKRNATKLVSVAGMINLLKDWSLIPFLCSQYKANILLKQQLAQEKVPSKFFSYSDFLTFICNLTSSYYKENDNRELLDKTKLLEDQFQWADDVIELKHLLTLMNTSDGRAKFSQSRNACLIPSFVGVDGSEAALTVYLESQQTSASNGTPQSTQQQDIVMPTFREIEMSEAVQLLMRKNESTLISLALRYCSSAKTPAVSTTPGSKKDSRKSHVAMTMDAVYSCLHDFEVCPLLCGKAALQALYSMVELRSSPTKGLQRGLNFSNFCELLDQVAQNCVFGTKRYHTPESRVRAMFHHMNSSRGRAKLNRDSNALIINPLTGLETTDPKLESNSTHRKNVTSKVSAMISSTPEKDSTWNLSPSRKKLPVSHYQHLRTIKTPPRSIERRESGGDERPEW
eukprot:CAMPEP_0114415832 /NCGR_PEP_ID=MMETSP0103-20121206/2114_1 /TAXON_ID=37642 ORGANISM="Paraphysomonas imperforata, Strain PA2" /NCGR_SAMPLE_ID=MMETSP0103 /ASSEMBLY_ACC=CAM_ASM_000201 /LENGTH=1534 /DNA_ID=CAMNT_0001584031 /DNA_START=99 /DNA_END=4700 /DNA_ORIENTATION=-